MGVLLAEDKIKKVMGDDLTYTPIECADAGYILAEVVEGIMDIEDFTSRRITPQQRNDLLNSIVNMYIALETIRVYYNIPDWEVGFAVKNCLDELIKMDKNN